MPIVSAATPQRARAKKKTDASGDAREELRTRCHVVAIVAVVAAIVIAGVVAILTVITNLAVVTLTINLAVLGAVAGVASVAVQKLFTQYGTSHCCCCICNCSYNCCCRLSRRFPILTMTLR